MRIAHVVTYVSIDGAFGGPVAVARGQAEELARRGHEVDLLAGWDGQANLATTGVQVRLFPARRVGPGFSGLTAPGMLTWMRRNAGRYDAVHVHMGRDLVTLPAALTAAGKVRLVVQTHGMVQPDARARARALDTVTRRVLRGADSIVALTRDERNWLTTVAGVHLPSLQMLPNGIAAVPRQARPVDDLPPLVMFLARLHPRKRVLVFAEIARILRERQVRARFEVLGPDEGDLANLRRYVDAHDLSADLTYRGAIPPGQAQAEFARAAVHVLPSVGELFPMTVLEALAVGTPTVMTRDCGIATEFAELNTAVVTDVDAESLAAAVERLITDPAVLAEQQVLSDRSLREWLSIEAVATKLEVLYRGGSTPPAPA